MMRHYIIPALAVLTCGVVAAEAAPKKKSEAPPPVAHEDGTFCKFYGVKDPKVVVLMIDRTLPVTNALDRQDAASALEKALELTGPGYRLRVVTIREDVGSSKKLFDDCRPGVPQDIKSWFTAPTQSEDIRIDNPSFEGKVKAVVDATVHESNRLPQAPQSAIVATVADIGRTFRGRLSGLVLASDMIEGRLDDIAPAPDARMNSRVREELLGKAGELDQIPRLEGVTVVSYKINQWDRKNRPVLTDGTVKDIRDFWIDYFRMAGAASVSIN